MIVRTRECEEELNALDAQLGDGDLGSTLVSVAGAVESACNALPQDWGAALKHLAGVIARVSGSSFTSLLMLGLSNAGQSLSGKTKLSAAESSEAWRAALSAMLAVSGAQLGDKTMLDVIAVIAEAQPDHPLVERISRTIEQYRPMRCRVGRARVASERSMGRDDPGMIAMLRLVEGATQSRAAR